VARAALNTAAALRLAFFFFPFLLTVLVAEQMDRWILPVSGGGTMVICSIFVNPSLVSSVLVREGVLWSSKEIFDGSV
jgi:hypothetical protein